MILPKLSLRGNTDAPSGIHQLQLSLVDDPTVTGSVDIKFTNPAHQEAEQRQLAGTQQELTTKERLLESQKEQLQRCKKDLKAKAKEHHDAQKRLAGGNKESDGDSKDGGGGRPDRCGEPRL